MARTSLPNLVANQSSPGQTLGNYDLSARINEMRVKIDDLCTLLGIEVSGGVNTPATNSALRGRGGSPLGSSWDHPISFSLTNKSGSARAVGDVVVVDTANDAAFTTTTTADNPLVLGVVVDAVPGGIPNNSDGIVALGGRVETVAVTSATRGQYLGTSTTAGKAVGSSSPTAGTFGIALTAASGGFCKALVFPYVHRLPAAGSILNSHIASNAAIATTKLAAFPKVLVSKTANQSLANGTTTTLTWDTETYDTAAFHDNATNNSRLTVPNTGIYFLYGSIWYATNGTGGRNWNIMRNGSNQYNSYNPNAGSGNNTILQVAVILDATAGDYFEMQATQGSGGNLDIVQYSSFGCMYLGPLS